MENDIKFRLKGSCSGLTLLEVLLALAISGIFLVVIVRSMAAQRVTALELKDQLEVHYALITSQQIISEALRSAQHAVWKNEVLEVKPWGSAFTDRYYLADKNWDGIMDLYCEHLNVANPLVSGVIAWECTPQGEGLWIIHFEAKVGNKGGKITTYITPSR